jgi:aryl-alcohol dehydrogenase-like predicted oxidoreductase
MRFDYSHGAMLRQHQDSLQRMGLSYLDSVVIHDLDHGYHTTPLSPPGMVEHHLGQLGHAGGGFRALEALRSSGSIQAIGCALLSPLTSHLPSRDQCTRQCVWRPELMADPQGWAELRAP